MRTAFPACPITAHYSATVCKRLHSATFWQYSCMYSVAGTLPGPCPKGPGDSRAGRSSFVLCVDYLCRRMTPALSCRGTGAGGRDTTTHEETRTSLVRPGPWATITHRMTITMAPGASSDCTKAYPIASDAPTTSPIAMGTPAVCMGSHPDPYRRNVTFFFITLAPRLPMTGSSPRWTPL